MGWSFQRWARHSRHCFAVIHYHYAFRPKKNYNYASSICYRTSISTTSRKCYWYSEKKVLLIDLFFFELNMFFFLNWILIDLYHTRNFYVSRNKYVLPSLKVHLYDNKQKKMTTIFHIYPPQIHNPYLLFVWLFSINTFWILLDNLYPASIKKDRN